MGCKIAVRTEQSSDDEPQPSWEESEISSWGKKSTRRTQDSNLTQDIIISDIFLNNFKSSKLTSFLGKGLFPTERSTKRSTTRSYSQSFTNIPSSSSSGLVRTPLTGITSQLFLGSLEDARNEIELRKRKITHIISLIGPSCLIEGMSHEHNPMNDYGRSDLKCVVEKLMPFIEESQKPLNVLFVHCMSGQNRSASLVIAIIMKLHRKTLREAFRMVKKKRPLVQINVLYAKQLIRMELELFGKSTMPKDWMEINFVNVATGSVVFVGDDMCSYNNLRNINNYKKNSITTRSCSMKVIREIEITEYVRAPATTKATKL